MDPPGDPEDRDPSLARERTRLAWIRTAMSVAALGGAIVKTNPAPGLVVLGLSPLVWIAGRLTQRPADGVARARQLQVITVIIVLVSLVALAVAFTGHHSAAGR
jgi:uncharacterized membrane protein YidH (DUF202 family)